MIQQVELGQGISGRVPWQSGALDETANLRLIQRAEFQAAGQLVPAQRVAVSVQNEMLQFLCADLD